MATLVTGCAGFIGYHVCNTLLQRGDDVIGIDNLNDYYDVSLKQARLDRIQSHPNMTFNKVDLADQSAIEQLFAEHNITHVIHLAAQAGVRYSIINPQAYIQSNIVGFCHILEGCRHHNIEHLVFASSSSVYGANTTYPLSECDNIDHPMSFYAASKKANELMAHSYASLYDLPCTGLRFFTVYGPWGRPDMAMFLFTDKISRGQPIDVFNHGEMERDFTYIDDIVTGVIHAIDRPAQANPEWDGNQPDPATSYAPYKIYNIGKGQPEQLMSYIEAIEQALGKKAILNMKPMQAGDVKKTSADIRRLKDELDYTPTVGIKDGVARFVKWYMEYYATANTTTSH